MSDTNKQAIGALPQGWENDDRIDPSWLNRQIEEVIEPELPIIDPHHHLWQQSRHRYMLEEMRADLACGHDVRATVYIEASSFCDDDAPPELRSLGETRHVAQLGATNDAASRNSAICVGIVGFVALRLGDRAGAILEQHVEAGQGRLKGIRNVSTWDEDPNLRSKRSDPPKALLLNPEFRKGFAALAKLGLSFDAYVYHTQLAEVADLARAFPDTPIILNHLGGPLGAAAYAGRYGEVFEAWKTGMEALSRFPRVAVKLGGLGMPNVGLGFQNRTLPPSSDELAAAWKPYVETAIELFGPSRCMFESNFPVENAIASYRVLWNAFKRLAAGYSASEKRWLFHDCARDVYQLDLP